MTLNIIRVECIDMEYVEWPFGSLDDSDLWRQPCYASYEVRMRRIAEMVRCNYAFLHNMD